MSTSLRQLTNRIEDLYIDSPHSASDAPTPPNRRIKSVGTPNSPPSTPVPSTSRVLSSPSSMTNSATATSPLLRLSTSSFTPEVAVKERDTCTDDDTSTLRSSMYANSVRSRSTSYNPKQWRTSGMY